MGGESCRDGDRRARNSPTDGGECVGLPQQVRAARRRVLLPLRAEKGCRDGQQVGESRRARASPADGGECVGLPQQVRAARRRVLYVRNCATVEHVVARRRAIRRQEQWQQPPQPLNSPSSYAIPFLS